MIVGKEIHVKSLLKSLFVNFFSVFSYPFISPVCLNFGGKILLLLPNDFVAKFQINVLREKIYVLKRHKKLGHNDFRKSCISMLLY